MVTIFKRFLGILLILAATVGLVFSLGVLILTWQFKPNLESALVAGIDLVGDILETTSQGLVVTQEAVSAAVESIGALQSTLESTAKTMGAAQPMLAEIANLMEETLPNTVKATQESLTTAQESAKVIDNVLTLLSKIPLIGVPYDPQVSLDEALGQVVEEIDALPGSFSNMKGSLGDTGDNLAVVESDLQVMAQSIGQIQTNVSKYETVLGDYLASLKSIQNRLDALAANVPALVNAIVWALTIFLLWMAIAQIGLFTQGYELLTERRLTFRGAPEEEIKPEKEKTEEAPAETESADQAS